LSGESPYRREGYRYSPIFAFVLLPEVIWDLRGLGKMIFATVDAIAIGPGIAELCYSRGLSKIQSKQIALYGWILNPLAINICTRGSSEAIIVAIVIVAFLSMYRDCFFITGILLGIGTHVKIYPILHIPAFALALTRFQYRCISFLSGAAFGFIIPTWISMQMYPSEYIDAAILHHVHRIDHKHNFSLFWLPFFLLQESDSTSFYQYLFIRFLSTSFTLLIQIAVLYYLAKRDLIACTFAQTILLVTFNKVCTAQYFVWWFPLAVICVSGALNLKNKYSYYTYSLLFRVAVLWTAALAAWLTVAYQLEFRGAQVYFLLWLLSILFFVINLYVFVVVLRLSLGRSSQINFPSFFCCCDDEKKVKTK